MQDLNSMTYMHYSLDQNAKAFDTKGKTCNMKCFCILIQWVIAVYKNYNAIAFKFCIQKFTVYLILEPSLGNLTSHIIILWVMFHISFLRISSEIPLNFEHFRPSGLDELVPTNTKVILSERFSKNVLWISDD